MQNIFDKLLSNFVGEDKPTKNFTYAEVYEKTKLYAAALRKSGIKKDDIVACK